MTRLPVRSVPLLAMALLPACAQRTAVGEHEDAGSPGVVRVAASGVAATPATQATLPAGAEDAAARLAASPRHAEWVTIRDAGDSVRAWVVYPERRQRAPVVVVIHEIYGLSQWIRAVTDQLAAEGFIAIAPDFLTGKYTGSPDSLTMDAGRALIRTLDPAEIQRRINASARYATTLPAALPRYGIVGFCWGGGVVWAHAARAPSLGAGVVYYGAVPEGTPLADTRAPILAHYGEDDTRVNATIAPADSTLRAVGRTFEHHIYPGAGHGFLRQQTGRNGANRIATEAAWPATVTWFRRHLGG